MEVRQDKENKQDQGGNNHLDHLQWLRDASWLWANHHPLLVSLRDVSAIRALKTVNPLHVDLADLWLGKGGILLDDGVDRPSHYVANSGDDTPSAVLENVSSR